MVHNRTVEEIAVAARRLLDSSGSEAVTMRRVARAVGITPMAVYRHYRDRADLLNDLANEGFSELTDRLKRKRLTGSSTERLMQLFDVYLNHAVGNPRLFELMFLNPRKGARRYPRDFKAGYSPTANLVAQVVREGMGSGEFRHDDVWEIVFAMGALSHGLVLLYLGGRTSMTISRFRGFYRQSFRRYLHGIRK